MATTLLGNKNVGDVIKIKENGVNANYIIVHKGLPSSMYDKSCDGVWVLRELAHSARAWDSAQGGDYEKSEIKKWLNGEYLNSIDPDTRGAIISVKIPFKKGTGEALTGVQSGASGLSCKVFLLSAYEIGFTTTDNPNFPVDGARLDYFLNGTSNTAAKTKRICNQPSGAAVNWWSRSPITNSGVRACYVNTDGTTNTMTGSITTNSSCWARPAFVLPSNLSIDDNGTIVPNTAPEITANKSGNLGTLTDGFDMTYSVNDVDGDNVTVTETLDSTQVRKYTATLNKQETYSMRGDSWIKLANGSHTFKISATDGTDTVEHTVTFTRNNRAPVVTLSRSGDVGVLTDGYDLTYSTTDADNDAVTVTETLDSAQIRQYNAVLGQQEAHGVRGDDWLKTANGTHTFKVSATDGQQTAEQSFTYARNQTSLSVTLEQPFTADDNITACQLKVEGDIPEDAVCVYEVTNNALDSSPTWEDCTEETKAGRAYVFKGKGSAFNFRVSIQRGSSGAGGYITEISGGYE